jgi:hypothetical protein
VNIYIVYFIRSLLFFVNDVYFNASSPSLFPLGPNSNDENITPHVQQLVKGLHRCTAARSSPTQLVAIRALKLVTLPQWAAAASQPRYQGQCIFASDRLRITPNALYRSKLEWVLNICVHITTQIHRFGNR